MDDRARIGEWWRVGSSGRIKYRKMQKQGFVYIMSNKNRTTLYIGVSSNLEVRVLQHKAGLSKFSSRYNLFELVYYEQVPGIESAIAREKQLKNWHKDWKWNLVRQQNPQLEDLAKDWYTEEEIAACKRDAKEHTMPSAPPPP